MNLAFKVQSEQASRKNNPVFIVLLSFLYMNSVFKLLIAVIVFGALIYIILNLFVFPKNDPYAELAKTVKHAMTDAGKPICSKIDLSKNTNINTKALQKTDFLANDSIYIWFSSLTPKINATTLDESSSLFLNDSFKQLDFCAICFPGIIFKDYSDLLDILNKNNNMCELIFGKELLPLNNVLEQFNKDEQQGFRKISFKNNLPTGYIYTIYVINNEKNQTVSKNNLSFFNEIDNKSFEKIYYFDNAVKDINIELPKAGEKIVFQAVMQKNRNIFAGPLLPIEFEINAINVIPNDDYQMFNCKTTKQESLGKDFDLQKCLVYNYCEGCNLASHCVKAWQNKEIDSEAVSKDYSKSYLPFNQC